VIERDRISLLVRSAQTGDELAFAELVRSHQDRAVAYATAILGDYHLAEDAAQEAFVDAYRELRALRAPAAFGSWLRTIVFKHCDRLTRGKRPALPGLESALDIASPEPSPHEALETGETHAALRKRYRGALARGAAGRPAVLYGRMLARGDSRVSRRDEQRCQDPAVFGATAPETAHGRHRDALEGRTAFE
jgi:DNA-directed RNA polymerase specialized sigma24 family protein